MGEVFAAENVRTGRTVAVKVLRADSKQKSSAVERFRREARAAGAISSDYVTQVLDVEDDADHGIVLVFELLEGESLIDRLKRTGPMTFDELFPLVEQVWMGLTDAHKSGVIHRDLKPSNVFLERRPDGGVRVKILDFGISKIPKEVGGQTLTEMGQSLGTFSFMPPEQIGKAKTVDHRADIYACATLIYQAMSGQLPYAAKNILQMVDLKTKAEPRPLSSVLDGHVDSRLEAFLAKGLAREPSNRFQSAAEALDVWREMRRPAQPDRTLSPTAVPRSAQTAPATPNAQQGAAQQGMHQRHHSSPHLPAHQQQAPGRPASTVMLSDPRSHNASPLPSQQHQGYGSSQQGSSQQQPSNPMSAPKPGGTVAMASAGFQPSQHVAQPGGPRFAGAAAPVGRGGAGTGGRENLQGKGPVAINVPVVNDTTSEGSGDHSATIAMPMRNVGQGMPGPQVANAPSRPSSVSNLPRVHDDQERGQMGTQLMSHASLRQAGANIPPAQRAGSHSGLAATVSQHQAPASFNPSGPSVSQAQQPSQQQPSQQQPLASSRPDSAGGGSEGADLTTVYRRDKAGTPEVARRSNAPMIIGVVVVALLGFTIAAVVLRYAQTGTFFWQ